MPRIVGVPKPDSGIGCCATGHVQSASLVHDVFLHLPPEQIKPEEQSAFVSHVMLHEGGVVGVEVDPEIGVAVATVVGVELGPDVGVALGPGVAVFVGPGVDVGVELGLGVGVGVAVGAPSTVRNIEQIGGSLTTPSTLALFIMVSESALATRTRNATYSLFWSPAQVTVRVALE